MGKTYDVLSIQSENGNGTKILRKRNTFLETKNMETTTEEDTDSSLVTACGCRGACISKNELNEGPRLHGQYVVCFPLPNEVFFHLVTTDRLDI